jgi:peptidoglycan hydrolase-like protein with peptidoglycan-binding domain
MPSNPQIAAPRPRTSPLRVLAMAALALASVAGVVVGDPSGARPADAACSISTNLGLGSRGTAVQCLQTTLNARGFNAGPVDGSFGSMTFRAVTAFQRAKGLYVDGLVGRQTGTALGIWGTTATPAPSNPTPPPTSGTGCRISTTLRFGSSGTQVQCLQSALNAAGFSAGPVDGQFGSRTFGAVRGYQQSKGLVVDGVAGRQTATSLGIWGTTSSPAPGGSTSCTPPSATPSAARQVLVVTASGSRADVDLLMHDGTRWICARMNMSGRVGRNGVRPLSQRRSGDGTTPGGVFPLASMTAPDGQTFQFFGNGVNPGVRGTWRQIKRGDCWGATPSTADYNRLVTRTAANCQSPDEYLINFQGAYSRAAIIGANMGPNRSGDAPGEPALAAAIFLHRHSYDASGNSRPTAGCVSLNNDNLIYVLQRLVPGQAYFVIR